MSKKLEKGDTIKCLNEVDLKNWLKYLHEKGFGTLTQGVYIMITSEPGEVKHEG